MRIGFGPALATVLGRLSTFVPPLLGPNALLMGTNLTGIIVDSVGISAGPASLTNLLLYKRPVDATTAAGIGGSAFDARGNITAFPSGTTRVRFSVKAPGPNRLIRVEWDERVGNAKVETPLLASGFNVSAQTVANGRRSFTLTTRATESIYGETVQIDLVPNTANGGTEFFNYTAYEVGVPNLDGWRKDFVDDLARDYKAFLRFMDLQATNKNQLTVRSAANRPMPNDLADWRGWGLSIEQLANLSKHVGSPAWFCVGLNDTDDFIDKMVEVFDTILPANLSVYNEADNEIWNTAFPGHIQYRHWWTARHPTTGTEPGPNGSFVDAIAATAERHVQVMSRIKAAAEARGATVGKTGRFRRVLGSHQQNISFVTKVLQGTFTAADNSQTFTFPVVANTDFISPSGYFGDNAVFLPTPTTDIPTIHTRMRLEADDMYANNLAQKDLAEFYQLGLIFYEANHHIMVKSPGVLIDDALLESITQSPLMVETMGYALAQLRRVDETAAIGMFSYVGQRYRWFVKHYIDTDRADEPIYDAVLAHRDGDYRLPTLIVNNAPPTNVTQGDAFSYTPQLRLGTHQGRTTPTFSNFRNRDTGVATTPAARGLTASNGTLAGTVTGTEPLAFDVTASDSKGPITVTHSFGVTVPPAFDDYNVGAVTTPEQLLSANGWTGVDNNQVAINGAVRNKSFTNVVNATRPIAGSGTNRIIIMNMDRTADTTGQRREIIGFAGGLRIIVNFNGSIDIGNPSVLVAARAPAGSVPMAACEVRLLVEDNGTAGQKAVKMLVNGTQVGATYAYTLTANDTAAKGYGFSAYGFDQGTATTRPIFSRIRGLATA